MRNSDKCIIKTIVFLITGISCIWYLSTSDGTLLLSNNPITLLSVLSLTFLFAGMNQGAARGWREIELRRSNPEYFENEEIEED